MDINLFDYELPYELIAQSPMKERDQCRLLVVDRENKRYEDNKFFNIKKYLKKGDVLVRNNTKVIPARLYGTKEGTNAKVEVLLLKDIGDDVYECLCGNAKTIKEGSIVHFQDNILTGVCLKVLDEGIRHIKFLYQGIFLEELDKIGVMPTPPYIEKALEDKNDYQTVYAKVSGSSAAPTAGFHFTTKLLDEIKKMGVEIVDVTLNIGLGTFRPVKVEDTKDHIMHKESYEISKNSADSLNLAKKEGRRIIAIGTTAVRTLEANYEKFNKFNEDKDETNIFITPGYEYKTIDGLITNFHLPKSTLIMLVSAFMGRKFTLNVYKHAVENKYRFFSFGDAMFIYGKYNYKKNLDD